MNEKKCLKCGTVVETTARFCPQCGSSEFVEQGAPSSRQPLPTNGWQQGATPPVQQPAQSYQQPYIPQNQFPNQPAPNYMGMGPTMISQKKTGLKAWHIALIAVGAVIIVISMIAFLISGHTSPTDYSPSGSMPSNATNSQNNNNLGNEIYGTWSTKTGADSHSIVIDEDGTFTIIDGPDVVKFKYVMISATEIEVSFEGDTMTFKYKNGELIRYENGEADGYTYTKVVTQDIPIVGDWKFDASSIDEDALIDLMFMAVDDRDIVELMVDEFGKSYLLDAASSTYDAMVLCFNADNTSSVLVDPKIYRTAYITMMNKTVDAMAQMDLNTIAKIKGESLEEFQKQLAEEGKTWAEKCKEQKEMVQFQVELVMTDEYLTDMFHGTLNGNGIIEIASGRYSLEGNQLSLIDTETLTVTVSYKNQVLTIESLPDSSAEDVGNILTFYEGIKLRKVGS